MLETLKQTGFCFFTLEELVKYNEGSPFFYTYNYFIVIWNSGKSLDGCIESDPYTLPSNSLLFVSPNKKLEITSKDFEGYAFAFTSEFFERSDFESSLLNSTVFFDGQDEPFMSSIPFSADYFHKFYIKRLIYSADTDKHLFLSIAHNTIESLILEGMRHSKEKEKTVKKEQHHPEQITYNKFQILLQKHYKTEKKVFFYADALNMTPRSLNKATFLITQKHAKDIIIDKIIKESKRLIKYTNETIHNISVQMGFSDEGNFSSFFKKHAGQTPHEYKACNPVVSFN